MQIQQSGKSTLMLRAFIIVVFMITVLIAFFWGKKSSVSPYLIGLTEPIYRVNGEVVKNDNAKSFTIKVNKQDLKVETTNETFFNDVNPGPPPWPYLLKPQPPYTPTQKTIQNISVGNRVVVEFEEDLRFIKKPIVTARRVGLFLEPSSIQGSVKNIEDNKIIVEGFVVEGPVPGTTPGPQKINTYTVLVAVETEISLIDPRTIDPSQKPNILQYTIEDLKKEPGLLVNIYTDKNPARNFTLTALRIEPFFTQ